MRRVLGVSVPLVAVLAVSLLAQAPGHPNAGAALGTPPDAPSFRAGTTLVEFTVVVTDAKTSLVRVVIRDRYTGHYGTLDVPISALRNLADLKVGTTYALSS